MHVCNIHIYQSQIFLTLGGCLSVICLAIIFYLFYFANIPNLRRHPTTIIIRRCWLELIFVSQYLWFAFAPYSFFWDEYSTKDDDNGNYDCETNPNIWPLSWLTQYSLLGAELWFLILSIDIHVSLTNPFSSHIINDRYYQYIVNGISVMMATILVSVRPIQYGISTDPMIWVKDADNNVNYAKVFMLYLYSTVIFIYCSAIMVWARWQIHRGLKENLKARKYSVSKQTRYVIGYFIYYMCLYSFQFVLYLNEDFSAYSVSKNASEGFRTWCAFLYASRGIYSLMIFVATNYVEFKLYFQKRYQSKVSGSSNGPGIEGNRAPMEDEELVQLNIALQQEIVKFTAAGIQKSVREYLKQQRVINSSNTESNNNSTNQQHSSLFSNFSTAQQEQSRRSSLRRSLRSNKSFALSSFLPFNLSFAVHSKLPGDSVSFIVEDYINGGNGNSVDYSAELTETQQEISQPQEAQNDQDNSSLDSRERKTFSMDKDAEDPQTAPAPTAMGSFFNLFGNSNNAQENAETVSALHQQPAENHHPDTADVEAPQRSVDKMNAISNSSPTRKLSHQSSYSQRLLDSIKQILTPQHSFRFSDFSPASFAKIRALSNVTTEEYLASFNATTMPNFSEGRSGAFMYFTTDFKFIVKTLTLTELEKLLSILPDYEEYLTTQITREQHQPLLTRFLGAHRIIMYDIPIYFVVMKNICPRQIDEKYDLKGSWINRHGSKKKKDARFTRPKKHTLSDKATNTLLPANNSSAGGGSLFLDNDLQNCFLIEYSSAREIARQLYRDTKFLEDLGLMDYSLLVGVKRRTFDLEAPVNNNINNNNNNNSSLSRYPSSFSAISRRASDASNHQNLQQQHREENAEECREEVSSPAHLASPASVGSHSLRPRKSLALLNQQQSTSIARVNSSAHPQSSAELATHVHGVDITGRTFSAEKNSNAATRALEDSLLHVIEASQVEGAGTFYLGLIDILQEYDWRKWLERMTKIYLLRKDGDGISTIDPVKYRVRFLQRAVVEVFDGLSSIEEIIDCEEDNNNQTTDANAANDKDLAEENLSGNDKQRLSQQKTSAVTFSHNHSRSSGRLDDEALSILHEAERFASLRSSSSASSHTQIVNGSNRNSKRHSNPLQDIEESK